MRCLVIGASKGIGREIHAGLLAQGETAWGLSRSSTPPLDLTWCGDTIEETIASAISRIGGLDLLVVSAGMGAMHTPFEENEKRARQLMQTNYLGPTAVWRACVRELLKSRGTAVFIGSTCADRPSPGLTLYRASKAALHAFVLNQAHVYRGKIRVHVLAPGWVDTPMTNGLKPELKEKIVSRIPAGRFATAQEVAGQFVLLLNNKLADIYHTHEDAYFTTESV